MSGCKDCAKAQKRIEDLEEKLAVLQFEFDSLKSKMYKPNKKNRPMKLLRHLLFQRSEAASSAIPAGSGRSPRQSTGSKRYGLIDALPAAHHL